MEKVRTKEISELQAIAKTDLFHGDFNKYSFIQIDHTITSLAATLITNYGNQGLRTFDSIQLSTSVFLKDKCGLFITADKLLNSFFQQYNLPANSL